MQQINKYLVEQDPALNLLISTIDFEKVVTFRSPYVALLGAIIGQRISYQQAKALRSGLYQACGEDPHWTSIDIGKLDFLPENVLQIIRNLNEYLKDKPHDYLNNKDNIRLLEEIQGIGPWTIETTLLSTGLDLDVFPTGDLFIKKRLKKLYNLEKMPTPKQINVLAEKWKPYRGYVAWYFWRWF